MSPEKGRSQPYDEKDDIFALGCILFELTTMTTTHSVAQAGLFNALDKVPEMVEAVRAAHPRFAEPVRAMLSEDPTARPSAADLCTMLGGF